MSNDWLQSLIDHVCKCLVCNVKGRMSPLAYKIFSPDDNDIGTWLVQIAPTNGEIVGGKHNGSEVFDPIDADLLELGKVLDEIETFIYDPGSANEGPHIWLSGTKEAKEVTIQIYVDPIDELDPTWSFDVNRGGWTIPDDNGE
jgi:hypothetical protein